jgi:rare lipoprotein A
MMTVLRTFGCAALLCMLVLLTAGCGKKVRAAKPPRMGATETGIASWYGIPYHGRRAANGEVYDMNQLTAAHRTLPFDTWVRVKNLDNGGMVEVRIQDRGPFVGNRIIDLSKAAAQQINMIGPGTARVRLTVIRAPKHPVVLVPEVAVAAPPKPSPAPIPPAPAPAAPTPSAPTPSARAPSTPTSAPAPSAPAPAPPAPPTSPVVEPELFAVQIGAFQDKRKAEALRDSMKERYGAARIVARQANVTLWRVLVGQEDSQEKATALAEKMKTDGTAGFVVRLDVVPPEIK